MTDFPSTTPLKISNTGTVNQVTMTDPSGDIIPQNVVRTRGAPVDDTNKFPTVDTAVVTQLIANSVSAAAGQAAELDALVLVEANQTAELAELTAIQGVLQGNLKVIPRAPQNITMTAVVLPANVSTYLIGANPTRKSIQVLNVGVGFATTKTFAAAGTGGTQPTAPGQASATSNAVTIGLGYPLEAASTVGHQGGSTPIYDGAGVSLDEWDAISTVGTTLLVLEGN